MRGKHVLLDTLRQRGVEYIFGNPGTTESPLLDALVDLPGALDADLGAGHAGGSLSYVLALHEAVAIGAAHYYSQASGRTGVVNLHVAPGLGNALGMLYNAKEANSPMLVTAGQQDTRMRLREPLLADDLVAMAAPLVKWSVQAERADELGLLLDRALRIAHQAPKGPVFVALPIDVLEQETECAALPASPLFEHSAPDPRGIENATEILLAARSPAIILSDGVAYDGAQKSVVALAEAIGAPVWIAGLVHQLVFPLDHPHCRLRLPFDYAGIRTALAEHDVVVLIGGRFFEEIWYDPGSPFAHGARVVQIDRQAENIALNLPVAAGLVGDARRIARALVESLEAAGDPVFRDQASARSGRLAAAHQEEQRQRQERLQSRWDAKPLSVPRVMTELARALPADGIVVGEAITATIELLAAIGLDQPGRYYGTRGGGIGQGLPGALGVQLAHPGQPVVAVSGDGSAMYSIQALWTAAHHRLPITFVLLHNREYKILKHNMNVYRRRFGVDTERPYPHMDLTRPELHFVTLAAGMGVAGRRIEAPDELGPALEWAIAESEPVLLDVDVETWVR